MVWHRYDYPHDDGTLILHKFLLKSQTDKWGLLIGAKSPQSKMCGGFRALRKYGYYYENSHIQALLLCKVMEIIKKIPLEKSKERKGRLARKGYFLWDRYV